MGIIISVYLNGSDRLNQAGTVGVLYWAWEACGVTVIVVSLCL